MTSAAEYEEKVWVIVRPLAQGNRITLQWDTPQEAKLLKARIIQIQKELRLVKKDIAITKRSINSAYTSKKTQVGKGAGAALAAGVLGRKTAGKMNVLNRDSVRLEQASAIAPYENVISMIDNLLVQLDRAKIELDS